VVRQTFTHPTAAFADQPQTRRVSVAGGMLLAVVFGAFFGLVLSVVVAPDFALAFALFGAMSFAAGTVVLFLIQQPSSLDCGGGLTRADQEIRQSVADTGGHNK